MMAVIGDTRNRKLGVAGRERSHPGHWRKRDLTCDEAVTSAESRNEPVEVCVFLQRAGAPKLRGRKTKSAIG